MHVNAKKSSMLKILGKYAYNKLKKNILNIKTGVMS